MSSAIHSSFDHQIFTHHTGEKLLLLTAKTLLIASVAMSCFAAWVPITGIFLTQGALGLITELTLGILIQHKIIGEKAAILIDLAVKIGLIAAASLLLIAGGLLAPYVVIPAATFCLAVALWNTSDKFRQSER